MAKDRATIIERIRNLLELADETRGGTENERALAQDAAQKMMLRYNVKHAELLGQSAPGGVVRDRVSVEGVHSMWKTYFYHSIAKPSFCTIILTTHSKKLKTVNIFGREDNVRYVRLLAEFLEPWLEEECRRSSRKYKREAQESGGFFNPRAFKRSFMESASGRIYGRLESMRSGSGIRNELITKEDAHNDQAIAQAFSHLRKGGTRKGSSQQDGHREGFSAGNRADLAPGRKLNA